MDDLAKFLFGLICLLGSFGVQVGCCEALAKLATSFANFLVISN